MEGDVRLKMCIEPTAEDFKTIHHELGHDYYFLAYKSLPHLFQSGANDGFHEAVGDALTLSITPEYLVKIGVLDKAPKPSDEQERNQMLKDALSRVAFLPFGKVLDQWRWQVFSGKIKPENYNQAFWALRAKYQGIVPPVVRTEQDFDPGAKYHIPNNVPYTRYFLAKILQFQFHRALCKAAGYQGPIHRCSIFGNKEAGNKLMAMLSLGMSKPWPEALKVLSLETKLDVSALLEYYQPLIIWLEEQNKGNQCGWQSN
jgi:peptidyl-dipeptidase A